MCGAGSKSLTPNLWSRDLHNKKTFRLKNRNFLSHSDTYHIIWLGAGLQEASVSTLVWPLTALTQWGVRRAMERNTSWDHCCVNRARVELLGLNHVLRMALWFLWTLSTMFTYLLTSSAFRKQLSQCFPYAQRTRTLPLRKIIIYVCTCKKEWKQQN